MREYERFSTSLRQCLCPAPLIGRYPRQSPDLAAPRGVCLPALSDAVGRRADGCRDGDPLPGAARRIGVPAGGAIFAGEIARQCGLDKVLSYDMGGTTAKICLIDDLKPQTSRAFEVAADLSLQEGERAAAAHSGHRDGRDRRRRRVDRQGRIAEADHRRAGQFRG